MPGYIKAVPPGPTEEKQGDSKEAAGTIWWCGKDFFKRSCKKEPLWGAPNSFTALEPNEIIKFKKYIEKKQSKKSQEQCLWLQVLDFFYLFQLYDKLRKVHPNFIDKIKIIEGDVGQLGLGISPEDRIKIINEVSSHFTNKNYYLSYLLLFIAVLASIVIINAPQPQQRVFMFCK